VVILDYILPDGDGVALALEVEATAPDAPVIIMSGMELSAGDAATCEEHGFVLLRKPFLADDVLTLLGQVLPGADTRSAGAGA
jgi:DNA-binding NtrC family response regulator